MNENLESFSLLWLDASVNKSPENIAAQTKLRAIINRLETFETVESCEEYIQKCSAGDRLVLIVSGMMGQTIVPRIDSLRQIISVYIYCFNEAKNREWSRQYSKVRNVLTTLPKLVGQIELDQISKDRRDEFDTFNVSETVKSKDRSSVGLTSRYVFFRLLIEELLRIEPKPGDREKLIAECETQYQGNVEQLKLLQDFKDHYKPDEAILWYTKKSPIYRILNKALRIQNIRLLYLFRFFIRDIYRQIENDKCSAPVTVYRVQSMSQDELKGIKRSTTKLLAMTSFVSTSLDKNRALRFLDTNCDLPQVCFEIYADPTIEGVKPFADISLLSKFKKEKEILFTLGTVYEICDVQEENNQNHKPIWIVKLKLCSENNLVVKTSFEKMKKDIFGDNYRPNKFSFGVLLQKMGKFDDAVMYYNILVDELGPNHPESAKCYFNLGNLEFERGNYDLSLDIHKKLLSYNEKILPINHRNVALSYNCIGNIYAEKKHSAKALESYNKALLTWKRISGEESLDVAMCLSNIGNVLHASERYGEARKYHEDALKIRKKYLPKTHADLATSYNNLGLAYRDMNLLDDALKNFQLSIDIKLESGMQYHPSIAKTYNNIALTYEKNGSVGDAINYYKKAVDIYLFSNESDHEKCVNITEKIKYLESQMKSNEEQVSPRSEMHSDTFNFQNQRK